MTEGIKSGIRTPWEEVRGQAVLGSEKFIETVVAAHVRRRGKEEIARRRELARVKPEAIMAAVARYYGIKPEEIKGRGQRYTEPRYVASYLMRRYGWMGLREIGDRVGLHFSAVGNAIQLVVNHPTRTMAQSLRELERKFKNPED